MRDRAHIFFLSVVLAVFCQACTTSGIIYGPEGTDIVIAPVSSTVTRAVAGPVAGTEYPIDETMGIFAFYSDSQGSWTDPDEPVSMYIDRGEFKYNETFGRWAGWDGSAHHPYFWPSEGSLIFAGYSPYRSVGGDRLENVSFDVQSKTLHIDGYVNDFQSDLMYTLPMSDADGNYRGVTGQDAYNALFHHALAQVVFSVRLEEEGDAGLIDLDRIVIDDVPQAGDLSVSMGQTLAGMVSWKVWQDDLADMVIFDAGENTGLELDLQPDILGCFLVIPHGVCRMEVGYRLHLNGRDHTEKMTFEGEWEAGKKYIYNIILSADNMEIVPEVAPWADNQLN